MTRLARTETVIEERRRRLRHVLRDLALTGAGALALFLLGRWLMRGSLALREAAVFVVLYAVTFLCVQVLLWRQNDYCLTDRRLILKGRIALPYDQITAVEIGRRSLIVRNGAQVTRIRNLTLPGRVATRINRMRMGVAPETGRDTGPDTRTGTGSVNSPDTGMAAA